MTTYSIKIFFSLLIFSHFLTAASSPGAEDLEQTDNTQTLHTLYYTPNPSAHQLSKHLKTFQEKKISAPTCLKYFFNALNCPVNLRLPFNPNFCRIKQISNLLVCLNTLKEQYALHTNPELSPQKKRLDVTLLGTAVLFSTFMNDTKYAGNPSNNKQLHL